MTQAGTEIDAIDENTYTTLHIAVREFTTVEVAALLDLGANIHGHSNCYDSPLHAAAARGDAAITELLLTRGADKERVNKAGKKAVGMG